MLQRAGVIAEIQVAQNGKVPVRILEVSGLCEGRLITRARFCKLSLAALHHTEFVIGGRLFAKARSEEHTSELQSLTNLVCRLLLEKKKTKTRRSKWRRYH